MAHAHSIYVSLDMVLNDAGNVFSSEGDRLNQTGGDIPLRRSIGQDCDRGSFAP